MKSFVLSLCTIIIVAILMILDSVMIIDIGKDMKTLALSITPEDDTAFFELEEMWEKHRFLISVSSPHKVTDEIEEGVRKLEAKYNTQSYVEFYETKALLNDAIDEILVYAEVSFDSIL